MAVDLPWADLDPRTHAFDTTSARNAIDAVMRPYADTWRRASSRRREIRREIEAAIGRAIVDEVGPWAAGWCWSPSEGGGGGPANGWCCSSDSVFAKGDRDAMATTVRAHGALESWRTFLEELDALFAMLRIETASLPRAKEVELAASRLLAFVVERTGASDAWYTTFSQTLIWYFQAAGVADDASHELVATTVSGRFDSWAAPDPEVARATFVELGAFVGARVGDSDPRDALADWRIVRERPVAIAPLDREPVTTDGHDDYIMLRDLARDQDRAERMAAALLVCRDSAGRGMALTFDQLAEWQRIVLGASGPVPFRTTDAFAKQGRECYRFAPELPEAFDRALAGAGDPNLPISIRAARVYLDVCFFHPFADGNARAARLALDHVLTSAGLALQLAEPVFALSRDADDPNGLWSLAFVIERSIGTR